MFISTTLSSNFNITSFYKDDNHPILDCFRDAVRHPDLLDVRDERPVINFLKFIDTVDQTFSDLHSVDTIEACRVRESLVFRSFNMLINIERLYL